MEETDEQKPVCDLKLDELDAEIAAIQTKLDAYRALVKQARSNPFFDVLVKLEEENGHQGQ